MKTAQKVQKKPKAIRSGNGKAKIARVANGNGKPTRKPSAKKLVVEMYEGEPYEYYPLGKYVVAAPGVCGGRPTFKYTRIDAKYALDLIAAGWQIDSIANEWWGGRVSADAIRESIQLASQLLSKYKRDGESKK